MNFYDTPATLKQRIALTNLHTRLGWPCTGIRNMTRGQASAAIDKAMKANNEKTEKFTIDENKS